MNKTLSHEVTHEHVNFVISVEVKMYFIQSHSQ